MYDVGDVISTYTYRMGLEGLQISSTTAIGLTQSVLILSWFTQLIN